MLNFDEFRAVSNRDKARESGGTDKPKSNVVKRKTVKIEKEDAFEIEKSEKKDEITQSTVSRLSTVVSSIGEFLETHQMQAIYVFLIIVDTFVAMGDIFIGSKPLSSRLLSFVTNQSVLRALRSFSTFSLLFFIVEITSVSLVFRGKVLGHLGYILDILIITFHSYCDYTGYSKISRLLNFIRFWRLFRFFSAMVMVEQDSHSETKAKLETVEAQVKTLNLENFNARAECEKEKEARNAIESMLQSYKDEVDTLNEALKIAAMDIAEVAQGDEMNYDFEEADLEDFDENDEASASHGGSTLLTAGSGSRSKNKAAIMSSVMANESKASNSAPASTAFLVHEDGTFDRK